LRAFLQRNDVRFAVLGNRSCGKTTLIKRVIGRAPDIREGATSREEYIGKFKLPLQYISVVGHSVSVKRLYDFGGDPDRDWPLWDAAFTRDQPDGIIFMVDHENLDQHREAFEFFLDFLEKKDTQWLLFKGRHVAARERLKVVLFLINKEDELRKTYSFEDIYGYFADLLRRLDSLKIPTTSYACSALEGTNVNEALADFFGRIFTEKGT